LLGQNSSQISPEATIAEYIEACRAGSAERLQTIFHPNAQMAGYYQGDFYIGNPKPFFDEIRDNACDFCMKYKSVVGTGKATLVEELDKKRQALDIIKSQYSDRQFQYPENMVNATAVIKVEIDSMTGRHSG